MKKLIFLLTLFALALISCEKEPILTLSVEQITAPANGNSTSVTVTANNPWTVSGNDWCTVSPSNGDGGSVMVTVTVKENATYDVRNCILTFTSAGLSQTVSVSQESNHRIILPKNTYEISSETQQISVEVKANVDYDVTINADWIKQGGTKSLSSKIYLFDIEKNDTYDAREGSITIKEKNGSNIEVINVKQAQKDAIIISQKEYELSSEAHSLEIKLQTNVDLEVIISDNAKNWISYVVTKALSEMALVFNIKENTTQEERCGVVSLIQKDGLQDEIKIKQASKDYSSLENPQNGGFFNWNDNPSLENPQNGGFFNW